MYQRHCAVIESGLQAAVTDALSDTRTTGRAAVAAYAAVLPDRALGLTKRFDNNLQVRKGVMDKVRNCLTAGWADFNRG
jgi:hypothetical protein